DSGVGAVVLYSLFEEQLRRGAEQNSRMARAGSESFAESLSYFPDAAGADHGARPYLSLLERAAESVSVPVIGSINASAPGSWAAYARSMQECGAAAIELNIYTLPGDAHLSGAEVEQRHLDILAWVKDVVTVPVAVKLSPFFSATADMARRLDLAGADGLVLFNRFLQPDIDPERLAVTPGITLSRASEARLPLTWITLLHGRIDASLAATTGVEGPVELIKYLLAGADVVMTASALLRHGPDYATVLLDGLLHWMSRKGYTTIKDFRGLLAVPIGTDEVAHERVNYVSALRQANSGDYGPW
ncbi:dihydroorotate dehydrogenase-like protein, partial [Mycobacterium sp. ITM-2017-0098]